jgi:phosphopantetheinyl transferase (holo-ACP synthase)
MKVTQYNDSLFYHFEHLLSVDQSCSEWLEIASEVRAKKGIDAHLKTVQRSTLCRLLLRQLREKGQINIQHHSFSHTQEISGVIISTDKNIFPGVDIEKTSRQVCSKAFSKFRNENDQELNPLKLWTQKEASFKAISNALALDSIPFSQIICQQNRFKFKNQVGHLKTIEIFLKKTSYTISLATLNMS